MTVSRRRRVRVRRSPGQVVGRAVGLGFVGGAVLGSLLVVPDLLSQQFAPAGEEGSAGDWLVLLYAVPVGGLVALPAALLAAGLWCSMQPRHPRWARLVACLGAAVAVAVVGLALGFAQSPITPVAAASAAVVAFALAPAITTRRAESSD